MKVEALKKGRKCSAKLNYNLVCKVKKHVFSTSHLRKYVPIQLSISYVPHTLRGEET